VTTGNGESVELSFDSATMSTSNLGGQGGEEPTTDATPPVLHYAGVGTLADGTVVDLVVSNETAYAAFKPTENGLVHMAGGSFGAVNLQAPDGDSSELSTFVQLRYTFVDGSSGLPLTLDRTYVTFYDFDDNRQGVHECLQAKGGIVHTAMTDDTELEELDPSSAGLPDGLAPWAAGVDGASAYLCSTRLISSGRAL